MYLIMIEVGVDELGLPFYEFHYIKEGEDLQEEIQYLMDAEMYELENMKVFEKVQHGELMSWEEYNEFK